MTSFASYVAYISRIDNDTLEKCQLVVNCLFINKNRIRQKKIMFKHSDMKYFCCSVYVCVHVDVCMHLFIIRKFFT